VFGWVKKRRAAKYLNQHPEDELAVRLVLRASSARDAAARHAGRKTSDQEWMRISWRWERAWEAINGSSRS
jgi:hypothetical protein